MRRLVLLMCLLVLFSGEQAYAQRTGPGLFLGTGVCSDVTGQVTNQTYCMDYSSGALYVWSGSAWQPISGNGTVNSSTGTDISIMNTSPAVAAQAYFLASNGTTISYFGIKGTGATVAASGLPANSAFFAGGGGNSGTYFGSDSSGAPLYIYSDAQFAAGALKLDEDGSANFTATLPGADFLYTHNVNGPIGVLIQNSSAGAGGAASFMAQSNDHTTFLTQFGAGYTANSFFPPDTGALETDAANEYIGNYSGGPITFHMAGTVVGGFQILPSRFVGLCLGGFANICGTGSSWAGLAIGNEYFTATNWAGVSLSGATYYNASTGQWIADGGAGSGVGLFNTYQGQHNFYYAGGTGSGAVVNWIQEAGIDGNALHVTHIDNLTSYGVPSCINCASIPSYSRDTSGYVQVTGTWPIQLNFAKPFLGSAICVGNTLAGPPNEGVVSFVANSTTSIQIYCRLPGGAVCSAQTAWISYHCFGGS